MHRLLVNPSITGTEYGALASASLAGWSDLGLYEWVVNRTVLAGPTDVLLLQDDSAAIAGTTLVYRQLAYQNQLFGAGILCGSWTDPNQRGQGCFSTLIEAARTRALAKECQLLIAFVRASNASYRRLLAAGACIVPTFYCSSVSTPESGMDAAAAEIVADSPEVLRKLAANATTRISSDIVEFCYSEETWLSQFWCRPCRTVLLQLQDGGFAICSIHEKNIVLHYLSGLTSQPSALPAINALRAWSVSQHKNLIMYTSVPAIADGLRRLSFCIDPGYITVLSSDSASEEQNALCRSLSQACWNLQDGDKM